MNQSEPTPADPRLARRGLLRGGAVLAGAAGLAAASAVTGATPAHAADGDTVTLGTDNAAARATTITIGATSGSAEPALSLKNATGPALELNQLPESWTGTLAPGQLAGRATGPIVGVDFGSGPETTYVALGLDIDSVPRPIPTDPTRLLDTRTFDGRALILGYSSSKALDSQARLVGGQWLDLGISPVSEGPIDAIFANLTVTGAASSGYATVYPLGTRPTASSINYVAGQTIANAGFFALGVVNGWYAVRIHASATTHVLLDATGVVGPAAQDAADAVAGAAATAKKTKSSAARRSPARRPVRSLGRR